MFKQQLYIKRREQLRQKVPSGVIVLIGNRESPMNYRDNSYHFRQDSTFLYYFGIQTPDLAAIIDIELGQTIIFGKELDMDAIIWMGRQETLVAKAENSGVQDTRPTSDLVKYIRQAQDTGRTIHFLPPYRAENAVLLANLVRMPGKLTLGPGFMDQLIACASEELIKAVVAQRSIKSQKEIEEIEKAVNTSVEMHETAMRLARPGMTEREVAAAVHQIALASGGNIAYPIIMTTRGEILHNHHHGNTLQLGQLLLNDSGAETSMGYAGDLTRTFPTGASFTSMQAEAYQIVLDALETATAALAPGIRYLDIHLLACQKLVEGLTSIGLMQGDPEEAVSAGAHTLFFQCGTGHMMGLDVHDMEDLGEQFVGYTPTLQKDTSTFGLKSLRLAKELEAGYVLTIEPGLYFIPELIDLWESQNKLAQFINYDAVEKYRNFGGIRIEDNLLITPAGYRLLGRPLAKSIPEVEALRAAAFQ